MFLVIFGIFSARVSCRIIFITLYFVLCCRILLFFTIVHQIIHICILKQYIAKKISYRAIFSQK